MHLALLAAAQVAELPFSAKQGQKQLSEIVLQGNHCESVAAIFTAVCGIPKRREHSLIAMYRLSGLSRLSQCSYWLSLSFIANDKATDCGGAEADAMSLQ